MKELSMTYSEILSLFATDSQISSKLSTKTKECFLTHTKKCNYGVRSIDVHSVVRRVYYNKIACFLKKDVQLYVT